ncbi:MAG: alpha/beta hydrolase [Cyclobacteriaceae bacterium]|nr:alpha/beta hydrolase [Cyclobacteriaceae bacterium]
MNSNINYTISGNGRPFVFQHGLGANLQQAQGILGGLENMQLMTMDCPGHGKSPYNPETVPSFQNYTDAVIEMLDKEGVDQAVFGGISMGSGISVQTALRYPERVKGLVLVRPAWLDAPGPENLRILLEVADCLQQGGGQGLFEKRESFQKMQSELPLAASSVLGMFTREQLDDTPKVLEHMVNDAPIRALADLQKIKVPTLIIVNHDDPLHPYHFGEIIQKQISGSQVVEVTSRYKNNDTHTQEVQTAVKAFFETYFN